MAEAMGDELRLAGTLLLNAALLVTAWHVVRRLAPRDLAANLFDVLLLWLAVQYIAVGLPGVLGVLNAATVAATAIVLMVLAWLTLRPWQAWRATPAEPAAQPAAARAAAAEARARTTALLPLVVTGLFVLGWIGGMMWFERHRPIMADDALTYHLPAAVQWLQDGRIGIFETWFHNPANTHSPLGGSVLIAWWTAPMGNDVLARFVQAPALLAVMLGMVLLGRGLLREVRAAPPDPVAANAPAARDAWPLVLIAAAAVLSKPLIRQVNLGKDDLLLCAFFIAVVVALLPRPAAAANGSRPDRLFGWRLGIAAGLLLATKYTALLMAPVLLLLIHRPLLERRLCWQWLIALTVAAALAGPWYLRNLWWYGNPLFPLELSGGGITLLPGMFSTVRHEALSSIGGIIHTFSAEESYQTLPSVLWGLLGLIWAGGLVTAGRVCLRRPLLRLCLLGPPIGLGLFILLSPVPELRFVFPVLLLGFACFIPASAHLPVPARIAGAAILLAVAALTARTWAATAPLLPIAAMIGAAGAALWLLCARVLNPRTKPIAYSVGAVGLALGMAVYIWWPSYLENYRETTLAFWEEQRGETGDAWSFVRDQSPADAVIAYTNTHFVYPLQGYRHERRALYIPPRPRVEAIDDLPRFERPLPIERIILHYNDHLKSSPDPDLWIERLRRRGVTHLLVLLSPPEPGIAPPEAAIAADHPHIFQQRFANEAAVVYELRRD